MRALSDRESGDIARAAIGFGLFGDALVDPLVVERAKYLRSRLPLVSLWINTNGAAFSRAKHSSLSDLVSIVSIHCESLIPETYDYLMQPLRAQRVFPKYEQILAAFPNKVNVSVPTSKRNVEELPAISAWFLERGAINVSSDFLSSRCAEDRSLFESLARNPTRIRCAPEIMDHLVIDCDGQILICCQDFRRAEGIGSLQHQSLAEALISVQRLNARKLLAEHRHDELATCSRCYADIPV